MQERNQDVSVHAAELSFHFVLRSDLTPQSRSATPHVHRRRVLVPQSCLLRLNDCRLWEAIRTDNHREMSKDLSVLPIPPSTLRSLLRAGYETIDDVNATTPESLAKGASSFGRGSW